jgi:O-acetylhomoserine (thiol)-lyase
VIAAGALYGGTVTMLAVNLRSSASRRRSSTPPSPMPSPPRCGPTRAVFASLGNPSLVVLDIAAVADIARARRAAGDRQHGAQPLPV